VQACRLPPACGATATCLMSCLWTSCLTLTGLFQAPALGLSAEHGNIWLRNQCSSRLMQEAATMARIAAELYRLVDSQAQQVSVLRLCCCCLGWVQAALTLLSRPSFTSRPRCQCSCTSVLPVSCALSVTSLPGCSPPCQAQQEVLLMMRAIPR